MKKAEYREKINAIFKKYEGNPGYTYVTGYAPNRMLKEAGLISPAHFDVLRRALQVTVTPEEFELLTAEDYRKL